MPSSHRDPAPDREGALRIALGLHPEPVPRRQRGTLSLPDVEQALAEPGEVDPVVRESWDLYRRRLDAHQRNRGRLSAVLWAAHHLGVETAILPLTAWGWPPEIPIPQSARVRRTLVERWPYTWTRGVQRYGAERAREAAQGIAEEPGADPDLGW